MIDVKTKTINAIRVLSAEIVEKANSGHPGMPLGSAPMAFTLFSDYLNFYSDNPEWINRDRFVLSAGHASALLYSLLHMFGYDMSMEDLKSFRQFESKTPGHPEYGHTKGVDITTGPLGQGIANGVGMAMAERHLASVFNTPKYNIIDHYTYVLSGDGCLMEGVASEAASLAGTLGLEKLILLYDSNSITIEGSTEIAFTEDVAKRFESYGWQILEVEDGNNIVEISNAIKDAKNDKIRPSIIIIKTQIGYGCPAHQGKASCHGSPLGAENIKELKKTLSWEEDTSFFVPEDVKNYLLTIKEEKDRKYNEWKRSFESYRKTNTDKARLWDYYFSNNKNRFSINDIKSIDKDYEATRDTSFNILNQIANAVPNLIGGSADLGPSNKTIMKNKGDFSKENALGRNLHFGVREHAMSAIANGMSVHGGLIPYVSTFFVFTDYMKSGMRLSALMNQRVIYVLTHDSIGVGEDGPTHQPIEHLASLRSIPNMVVIRPADFNETLAAWDFALNKVSGPTCLILSRQKLKQFKETSFEAQKGAYIILDCETEPEYIMIATGSELEIAYDAAIKLQEEGFKIRVVSMPSWELFERQDKEYKEKVLPSNVKKRLSIEALSSFGWHKYVGIEGKTLSIDLFGASAPAQKLFEYYGFTVENILKIIKNW